MFAGLLRSRVAASAILMLEGTAVADACRPVLLPAPRGFLSVAEAAVSAHRFQIRQSDNSTALVVCTPLSEAAEVECLFRNCHAVPQSSVPVACASMYSSFPLIPILIPTLEKCAFWRVPLSPLHIHLHLYATLWSAIAPRGHFATSRRHRRRHRRRRQRAQQFRGSFRPRITQMCNYLGFGA